MNDCITTTKQSTTKPCAYFLGCTVVSPDMGGNIPQHVEILKSREMWFLIHWKGEGAIRLVEICHHWSRERILLAGTKYNSRGPNITRGDHILLAKTKFYLQEWNITRGNVLITRGAEKLLAGTKYYSREYNITRGNELLLAGKILLAEKNYYSRESIYYSRERYITRGREILAVYGTRGLP